MFRVYDRFLARDTHVAFGFQSDAHKYIYTEAIRRAIPRFLALIRAVYHYDVNRSVTTASRPAEESRSLAGCLGRKTKGNFRKLYRSYTHIRRGDDMLGQSS